jgi:spore coat protein U-like protein
MTRKLALLVLLILACSAHKTVAQNGCSLTISTLNFGTYAGSQLDGTATGTVTCAGAWDIPFNAGTGSGATEATRKMTGIAGAELNYQLFTDSQRRNLWENTTNTELTGTGNANITVYGRIANNQTATPGTYIDTISSATTTFTVIVMVKASCSISATNLNFSTYTGTQINAQSTLTVNCTNKTVFDVGLSAGTATGATPTSRKMTGPGSATLNYSLCQDSKCSQNWGNTLSWGNVGAQDILQATGTGIAVPYNVYGQIPAGQSVGQGTYTDTITATLTY